MPVCLVCPTLDSVLNVKVLVPGEDLSRGLLRDCENFADSSFAALVDVLRHGQNTVDRRHF